MEIGASGNAAILAQAAQTNSGVSRSQPAPQPRESAQLQNSKASPAPQQTAVSANAPDSTARIGGSIDTFV